MGAGQVCVTVDRLVGGVMTGGNHIESVFHGEIEKRVKFDVFIA